MNRRAKAMTPLVAIAAVAGLVPATAAAQVADSSASPGSASGAAVDVPGVVVLNKSETTKDSEKVTQLSVAGLELLGETNGTKTGPLAPAGQLVDSINAKTCPQGPDSPTASCIEILASGTQTFNSGGTELNTGRAELLGVDTPADGINVAGSNAFSANDQGGTRCIDGGAGYLIVTKKQFDSHHGTAPLIFTTSESSAPC